MKRALRNPKPRAVKGHLLFEVYRTELRGPRPEARILVSATTVAKFFAYFLTPKSRAPLAKRQLLALAGQAFLFVYPTKRNRKKAPLREPGYLGLLLGAVRQTHTPQACSDKCLP